MNLILIYKILTIIISTFAIFLGLWVYFNNRRSNTARAFLAMSILIALWLIFYYFANATINKDFALFFTKLIGSIVSLFFISFWLFFLYFLKIKIEEKFKIINYFIIIWSIFLLILSLTTNFIFKGVIFLDQRGIDLILGKGKFLYFSFPLILSFFVIYFSIKKYRSSRGEQKKKILYFLVGSFIWIGMNMIFNMIFPLVINTLKFSNFGNYSAIFLLGFTAFAILKQNLFGVKVLLTELLVGVMGIILFILPFFIPVLWIKIILSIVFIIFCFIGYSLIKYTRRGERQNEFLEKEVKERTKKLQERANELEKFYKMIVGRELKMIELKKKLKNGK